MQRVLGLDIGGANLKAAHTDGTARLRPFALWKQPNGLTAALRQLLGEMPAHDRLAVTMTGELCDCYETRRQGVLTILDAVEAISAGRPVAVWCAEGPVGRMFPLAEARKVPLAAAAGNWLALAAYAGRFAPHGPALLLDIGSTTADLVPLSAGRPVPQARLDADRLRRGELVYTGVWRTPVCALLGGAVAAEWFATMLDVYLLLGELPESGSTDTADGRPATRPLAHARLARLLCADGENCPEKVTRQLAERAARAQRRLLGRALQRVLNQMPAPPQKIVLAGSGEFLGRQVLRDYSSQTLEPVSKTPTRPKRQRRAGSSLALQPGRGPALPIISLADRLGPDLSTAACAYAVAVLAAEGKHG
jgi:probable H4MPT-linked C1 transfer pathway protein